MQGMGGLMSITGQADGTPGAEPMKVGVAVSDLVHGSLLHDRDPRGTLASGTHRRRPDDRHGAVRLPGGCAGKSGDELPRRRCRAGAHGERPSQHRSLSGIPDRRWPPDSGRRQRSSVSKLLRRRACLELTCAPDSALRQPMQSARATTATEADRCAQAGSVPARSTEGVDHVAGAGQRTVRTRSIASTKCSPIPRRLPVARFPCSMPWAPSISWPAPYAFRRRRRNIASLRRCLWPAHGRDSARGASVERRDIAALREKNVI